MLILSAIFWTIFILFIWFETDAVIEYSRLVGLSKLTKAGAFLKYLELNPKASYFMFLRKYYNCFFVRLITCPPCLTFWIVLILCFFYKSLYIYPIVYITSYTIFIFLKKRGIY